MKPIAFYGRVSTEDQQDPEASHQWQRSRAEALIAPHGGVIVAEYFDIGESRSLPWKRRPQANRLLEALVNENRGFDAVVIGEPQRAFYGSQYGDTFPLFVHFGVELWVPEIGGPIDPSSDAHDLIMNLYGGMGKGERNRIKTRVRTAMNAQVAIDGKYQGGRPPYGYRLADAGPHPNPAKAADGRRLHVLEPHPDYAPFVQRIFADFLSGQGIKAIATALTHEGIPSPSAADPARNRHRTSSRGAWGQSAVRAILKNPRYTGYEVWARQRKDEVLLDIEDVAAGHVTKQRWNAKDKWQWSREPAHPALVSRDDWEAAQIERTRAERKNAELRLRRLTTGKGLTEDEIRQVVQSLADAVKLLAGASPEGRRRVYEAAQLEVLYDHENRRGPALGIPVGYRWCRRGVLHPNSTHRKRLDPPTGSCVIR